MTLKLCWHEIMSKNGNRTHNMLVKWESNPWIFSTGNRTHDYVEGVNWNYTIVWAWESNQEPIQVWNRNPIQVFKRDSNPWICCKDESKQYKCSNLGIEPMNYFLWDKILVYLLLSKIFLIFYTLALVVVILNLCGMAKVAYEAGHCLHGHHEFGWISLHRWMRSV